MSFVLKELDKRYTFQIPCLIGFKCILNLMLSKKKYVSFRNSVTILIFENVYFNLITIQSSNGHGFHICLADIKQNDLS